MRQEYQRRSKAKKRDREAEGKQVTSENSQEFETNPGNLSERTADTQELHRLTYHERKTLGICRDCDEEVAVDSTIMCEVHNARMREYRKKYKAKKRAEAKEAKAD